jgi:ABC-type sugar transport system permease subunit
MHGDRFSSPKKERQAAGFAASTKRLNMREKAEAGRASPATYRMFLTDTHFLAIFENAFVIGAATLVFCFPMPIILALLHPSSEGGARS